MKSKFKHFISLVLSALLIVSSAVSVSAYSDSARLYYATSDADFPVLAEDSVDVYNSTEFTPVIDYLAVNILAFKDKIDISSYNINVEDLNSLYNALLYYHPELINIKNTYKYDYLKSGIVNNFIPGYLFTAAEKNDYFEPFNSEIESIVSQAETLPNDLMKALFVHDYLDSNCEYATEIYELGYVSDYFIYNAYGCLVNNHSVCQGYSLAYKAIMDKLNIDTDYAVSNSMTHMWNTVTVNGSTYHVDVTFDDPIADILGRVSHKNFLCTDAEISTNHSDWATSASITSVPYNDKFWKDINSEICFSGDYMYYTAYDSTNYAHLKKRNINTGETEIIPSQLSGNRWFDASGTMYYLGSYSRIEVAGDTIYYTVPDGICSIKTDGTEDTRLYTLPDATSEKIYGFALKENNAYIQLAEGPDAVMKDDVIELDIIPVNPSSSPTQPSTSAPTTEPTEPSTSAPTTEPSEPASSTPATKPTQPSSSAPTTAPSEPASSTPATRPTQPASSTPVTEPSEPASSTPATKPTQPASSSPVTEPSEPASSTPATKPTEPSTAEPSETDPIDPISTDPTEPSSSEPSVTEPSEPASSTPATKPTEPSTAEPSETDTLDPISTDPTEPSSTEPSETEPSDNPELLIGDVNGDGVLDINDATYLQMYLAGYESNYIDESDDIQLKTADFNNDGVIDINDVSTIQMKLAGYASIN